MSIEQQIDGKIEAEGEIRFTENFWENLKEIISRSPLFDELMKSLQEPEPLDWYDIRDYELSEARDDFRIDDFPREGDILLVISRTGSASIKFNSRNVDPFDLETYRKIKHSYTEIYLTNTTQAGASLKLLFGRGDWELEQTTPTVDLSGLLDQDNLAQITDPDKLADGIIRAAKIATHAVEAAKVAENAITETKIAPDSIDTPHLKANIVTAAKIAAGTITGDLIASNVIATRHLIAAAITAAKIATNAITADKIHALAVTTEKLAALCVTAAKIAAGTITADKLLIARHILSGATWADNDPAAGSVSWSGATLTYNGATYTIVDGNTDKKYIWWDYSLSTTTFQVSDTQPTLTDDDLMVAYNNGGLHILIWNATLVDGRNIKTGTITADKYLELRNTYVFSDHDSLDATYPFELPFEIVSEMTAIQNVKLSFDITNFRAYATGVPSGGGHTTPSGGGHTTPSGGGHTTPSGGGETSGSGDHPHGHTVSHSAEPTSIVEGHSHGYSYAYAVGSTNIDHTHSCPSHTHSVSNHQHTVSAHTHTVSNHSHSLTFGIYEDPQSPTVDVYIDNGAGYGASIGTYATDQLDIDITDHISGTGHKRVKFTSDKRTKIHAWVMTKVDLTA